ncbi:NADP-dependent oxidoreductase [Microbacterium dextranolyticum]|uniref:Oxidoreductase n=1 Tax=Microbacterium dextranolyticum TaxID=36806 RepID=A0A9W6HLH0_9MICO|nr:NADP-dependent oxidoreductase [Microbacterium dextranolyticum]MBM7464365.1 NADPH2:quinone reductase [Microbacterium dextranolyticum]GLJ95362.1 oxidoreductase [Microbacterium dextranolyticum]
MKALVYSDFGGNDRFEITEREKPHNGPDTLVVRVVAAGINPVDYKIREGYLRGVIDTRLPAIPGWDVAGVVEQTGLDTPEFAVGDAVLAYARADVVEHGSIAEFVPVPVRTAAHKPDGLSFEQAAALPLTGLTALQALERAGVHEGQTVLIHGAAGGVGSIGVQLAVRRGARVVGTASERNHDYLRELGAEPVRYGDGLADAARALAPEGFDVIVDFAGGASLDSTPALLADGGTVVSIADPRARTEFGGHYLWVRPDAAQLAELAQLAADGDLRVEIAATYPLDEAAAAYAALEEGHTRGKIVVTV